MMTGSPVSRCGVNVALCLPRRSVATFVERRPSVAPSASTTRQCREMSPAFVAWVLFVVCVVAIVLAPSLSFAVLDRQQCQPPRRRARPRGASVPRRRDPLDLVRPELPPPDPDHRADDPSDHPPEECV